MKSTSVVAVIFVVVAVAPARGALTKGAVFACRDQATVTAGAKLRAKGDRKAGDDFMTAAMASGKCTIVPRGNVVTIDERNGALLCIRPSGGLDCFWTDAASVDQYATRASDTASSGTRPSGGRGRRSH